ncbi:MAG: tetratricopeptide repeat protein [Bacteroidota bacterium]
MPRILVEIANTYYREDVSIMKAYLDSAQLFVDDSTLEKDMVKVKHFFGDYYDRVALYDSAIYYYDQAILHADASNDVAGKAKALSKIGLVFLKQAQYPKASSYLLESAKLAESIGHEETMSGCYGYLGHLNHDQGRFSEAIKYHKMSRSISNKIENFKLVSVCDLHIGNGFHQLKQFDSALYYMQNALDYMVSVNDTLRQSYPLNNMGLVHRDKGEYRKSIDYLEQGLEIRIKYKEQRGVSFGLNALGDNYRNLGEHEKAVEYYEQSIEKAISINYVIMTEYGYKGLAESYAALNQHQKAYEVQRKLIAISDTLFNQEKFDALADAQTKYETEKKEQEIELLNTQNELQAAIIQRDTLYLVGAGGLIVALLIVGGLLFYQRELRNRTALEQEKTKLKSEQIKAVISSQEEERKRFAMDLHDDFGQMISALRISSNQAVKMEDTRLQINGQLDKMYRSLKVIAFNLMPQTLANRGLTQAVEELCLQLNKMGQIQFSYHEFEAEDRLDDDQKVAVYGVIQEVVNNIIKYANAEKVTINITGHEDSTTVMIEDDGTGFDLQTLKSGKGNGWRNIQSRMDLLNGNIDFDTQLGRRNTTVTIDVPFTMQQMQVA